MKFNERNHEQKYSNVQPPGKGNRNKRTNKCERDIHYKIPGY